MSGDENSRVKQDVISDRQDDIVTLSQIFSLPDLSYIDINLRERLLNISMRWPLLHELTLSTLAESQSIRLQQEQKS